MLAGIFDGGKGPNDALVVGDVFVGVQRDIKVDLQRDYQLVDQAYR